MTQDFIERTEGTPEAPQRPSRGRGHKQSVEATESSSEAATAHSGQGEGAPVRKRQQAVTPSFSALFDGADLSPEDFETDEWIGKIYTNPKKLGILTKTVCFHNLNAKGEPVSVNDARIYKYIVHTQHIFVLGDVPYVYEHGYYIEDHRGVLIKSLITDCILETFVKSTTVERIYKLFLQQRSLLRTQEELNAHSGWYINFENGMYDVRRQKVYKHTPKILSVNQVPWKYDPNADYGPGTEIEKFLRFAIPDENDREMLLEYLGLCCTVDTSQQKMLVICGDGGTGKSTLINLIQTIVGKRNISNVAMNSLSEKFNAINLRGKLMNSCADLEIDALDDVTMIKKLIGQDAISDAFKGKDVVSFNVYAKMLFSTNELPLVRSEKTKGFYRRLLILQMNQTPSKIDPDLHLKLEAEIPYLLHLAMQALQRMYERGTILVSENSARLTRQLRYDSDTIEAFLTDCCEVGGEQDTVSRAEIFTKYSEYCKEQERQAHTKNNFYKALRNKGFNETKTCGIRGFGHLRFKDIRDDDEEFLPVPNDATMEEYGLPFEM